MAGYLSKIFGASPVQPMQEHMSRATESVAQLVQFIEAVVAGDWTKAESLQQRIGRLENEADDQKKDLRLSLPSSLMLPVDRNDLLELLTTQDRIANRAKDIAGLMTGRRMEIPPQLAEHTIAFVKRCHDATLQALAHEACRRGYAGCARPGLASGLREPCRWRSRLRHSSPGARSRCRGAASTPGRRTPRHTVHPRRHKGQRCAGPRGYYWGP
jgi:hypothetical protein